MQSNNVNFLYQNNTYVKFMEYNNVYPCARETITNRISTCMMKKVLYKSYCSCIMGTDAEEIRERCFNT